MELHELQQLIFQELWKKLNYENHLNKKIKFELTPEKKDYDVCIEMEITAYNSEDNYRIDSVDIKKAWFQFPDFEAEIETKYKLEIERFILS